MTAPGATDIRVSSQGGNETQTVAGLGFLNGTDFVIIHAAVPTDAAYYINYTLNPSSTNNQTLAGGSGAFHTSGTTADCAVASCGEGSGTNKMLKIGSNATALDWILPTASSAEILKSNPKQVRITMSEKMTNVNVTAAAFTLTNTGPGNAAVPGEVLCRKWN